MSKVGQSFLFLVIFSIGFGVGRLPLGLKVGHVFNTKIPAIGDVIATFRPGYKKYALWCDVVEVDESEDKLRCKEDLLPPVLNWRQFRGSRDIDWMMVTPISRDKEIVKRIIMSNSAR